MAAGPAATRPTWRTLSNGLLLAVALAAAVFSTWCLISSGAETLAWGAVLLLAGTPLYFWRKRRKAAPFPATTTD